MRGRLDIDDEALDRLDRSWRGATENITWPLSIGDALHPALAMSAWVRAGARDPRCLWWVLARFGAEVMADECDELDDIYKARAIDWMRVQAQSAWVDDQPINQVGGWRFKIDASGMRIWEIGGEE